MEGRAFTEHRWALQTSTGKATDPSDTGKWLPGQRTVLTVSFRQPGLATPSERKPCSHAMKSASKVAGLKGAGEYYTCRELKITGLNDI